MRANILRGSLLVAAAAVVAAAGEPPAPSAKRPASRESLDSLLEPIREKYHLPALAGAIVRGNKVIGLGAVGVRAAGSSQRVTAGDKWHLGSDTKAMTATLCALLVEQGKLKWTSTLADVFPDLRETMDPDYRAATLEQLLCHRAGVPSELTAGGVWARAWQRKGDPTMQRRELLEGVLARPPVGKPGTAFLYSNAGVAIAGAMAEQVTGKPYETLMRTMLFDPLGMKSAGFGAAGTTEKIDQPRGHHRREGNDVPVPPGKFADNPPAIAPAGTVHCTLEDWAKFVSLHLAGDRGKDRLLKAATIKRLHKPLEGQDYAMGWIVTQRPWGGGTVLTHAGSNTANFAVVWMAPRRNFAVLITCNLGGDEAAKACDDAAAAFIQHYATLTSK